MDNKITLDDFITKSPEELLPSLTMEKTSKEKFLALKPRLKDYFKEERLTFSPSLSIGNWICIDNTKLKLTRVLPSTGRVFLQLEGTKEEFSVTRSFLTGEEDVPLFQVGDEVVNLQDNAICTVHKLIKSSRKVTVAYGDGTLVTLPESKLQKLELETTGE
jgi:hypothetical protein